MRKLLLLFMVISLLAIPMFPLQSYAKATPTKQKETTRKQKLLELKTYAGKGMLLGINVKIGSETSSALKTLKNHSKSMTCTGINGIHIISIC